MPWNLKPTSDDEYYYPVADCTNCGKLDIPFGIFYNPYEIADIRYYCLNCHEGELKNIKGYVSLIDLEDSEWDREL